MSCQRAVYQWTEVVTTYLPHLSKPQARVLALWSLGMGLARSCALSAVSLFLAHGLERKPNTVRRSSPLIPVNSVRQQTRHFGELGQPRARAVARQGDRAGADGAARESGVVQTH